MTCKEKLLLDRLKLNPAFNEMLSRLDLHPVVSDAELFSSKVSNRVTAWYQELQYSPVVERKTITESSTPRIFWSTQEISNWITTHKFSL